MATICFRGASRKADKASIIADMDGRVYRAMTASATNPAPNQEACKQAFNLDPVYINL